MQKGFIFGATFCFLFLQGCTTTVVNSYPQQEYTDIDRTQASEIEVYANNSKPSKSHYSIGTVYIENNANLVTADLTEKDLIPLVKQAAANMGADAVIDTHYTHHYNMSPSDLSSDGNFRMRAAGIAIKYGENKADLNDRHIDFLPISFPPDINSDAKIIIDSDNNIRLTIQYFMEKNGYFVNLNTSPINFDFDKSIEDNIEKLEFVSDKRYPVLMYAWITKYKQPIVESPKEDLSELADEDYEDDFNLESDVLNLIIYSKQKNEITFRHKVNIENLNTTTAMMTVIAGPIGLAYGLALDSIQYDNTVLTSTATKIIKPLISGKHGTALIREPIEKPNLNSESDWWVNLRAKADQLYPNIKKLINNVFIKCNDTNL